MRILTALTAASALLLWTLAAASAATTSSQILSRVKSAEAGLKDFKADMVITNANRETVSGMGEGYSDILKLEKATAAYKKPDKIRYDGYALGVKATYIQNGYTKLILASMIKRKENVKDSPGKRQDTLDLGFLSSRLWADNNISVVGSGPNGSIKIKLDPKFGGNDKRHDIVYVDSKTLRVLKRHKYRGSGELRVSMTYGDFERLTNALPIATRSTMYDPKGKLLGTVEYKNVKVNAGLQDSMFSLSQR